jgi:hypothetical protein
LKAPNVKRRTPHLPGMSYPMPATIAATCRQNTKEREP